MTTTIYSFFGPPGCGKGTVAGRLKKELGFISLSTGNLFRSHIQEQTKLGKELQTYIDAGQLVPDLLVNKMVVKWLKENLTKSSNIILDGYPRTKGQAEAFDNVLKTDKDLENVTFKVIRFSVPQDKIVRRLSSRVVCSNKKCQAVFNLIAKKPKEKGICDECQSQLIVRNDDKEAVVRERLKVFENIKEELVGQYEKTNTEIVRFLPEGSPDEVYQAFQKKVLKTKNAKSAQQANFGS